MAIKSYDSIEARTPVIDKETEAVFSIEKLDTQWNLVTEAVRREFFEDQSIRRACLEFLHIPVSESLPDMFLESIVAVNPRVAQLVHRYQEGIQAYLDLPPVPDEQLNPDIRNARHLETPERYMAGLKDVFGEDDPYYEDSMRIAVQSGKFLKGITPQERLLVAKRYKYARDVKLLALQAELVDQRPDLSVTGGQEVVLPSGVRLGLDVQAGVSPEMLNPGLWVRRKQLKDRVYEIEVGGKKYLLKERKTARHTDTKEHGHVDGLPSVEEFSVAQLFRDKGRVAGDRVRVNWERPVGYAVYPDGFSFSVFEYEESLFAEDPTEVIAQEIIKNKAEFADEFALIEEQSETYRSLSSEAPFSENALLALWRRLRKRSTPAPALSFEEFARVKAYRMEQQARRLMHDTVVRNGYYNSDQDGFAYKINKAQRLELEIFGFDFEYFNTISDERAAELLALNERLNREDDLEGIRFIMWTSGNEVTAMQRAAYLAMVNIDHRKAVQGPSQEES